MASLQGFSNLSLTCYTDAAQASCPDDRRSMSDYHVFQNPNLVSQTSSKQCVVSSTEFKCRGVANVVELTWIESLLKVQ